MRVLAICVEDPELLLGGMGRHVRELYRAMARRPGTEIDLLTTGPSPCKEFDGYRKWTYSHRVSQKPPAPGIRAVFQSDLQMLGRLLEMNRAGMEWDVIHAHEWSSWQVAQLAQQAFDLPIVSTMHLCMSALRTRDLPMDWVPRDQSWSELDVWIANQEGKLCIENDELILCSDSYCQIASQEYGLGVICKEPHLIPNGIDLDDWHPGSGYGERARREHALENRPVALFVGRIATMKGIEYLLEAVEREDTGYQVVIAGEVNADVGGEDWHVTQKLRYLQNRYPERLRWLGFQRDQELKDLYSAARVVVMPSTHEPFGIVALEAMAMGVPLITTGVDGLSDVVDDECSLRIRPRSSKAIITALHDLKDAGNRGDLQNAGIERVKQFNWDSIAEQTLGVYRLAVEGYCARQSE
jgi:glycosyltransferase involved in cell wall biosynthesis